MVRKIHYSGAALLIVAFGATGALADPIAEDQGLYKKPTWDIAPYYEDLDQPGDAPGVVTEGRDPEDPSGPAVDFSGSIPEPTQPDTDPFFESTFDGLDTDASGSVTRSEFLEELQGREALFERFDLDGNDQLETVEFRMGLYRSWDYDDNGALSVSEWDRGVDAWFGEADVNLEVAQWDDDSNGVISEAEFAEGLDETSLFAGFDANDDEFVEADEFYGGIYERADINRDEELDEEEGGLFDIDFSLFGDA